MNGLEGATQGESGAHLLQGEVSLFGQQSAELALVGSQNHGLAPRTMMARGNVPNMPPLLKELLYHTEGNPEAVGDTLPGSLVVVVGGQYPFAEIKR